MTLCLSTKMLINYFQWAGAHERLKEHDLNKLHDSSNYDEIDTLPSKKDKTNKNGKGKFFNK